MCSSPVLVQMWKKVVVDSFERPTELINAISRTVPGETLWYLCNLHMSLERGWYYLVGGSVELLYHVHIRGRCLILRRLGGDFVAC